MLFEKKNLKIERYSKIFKLISLFFSYYMPVLGIFSPQLGQNLKLKSLSIENPQ